jgi:hypothetical protein
MTIDNELLNKVLITFAICVGRAQESLGHLCTNFGGAIDIDDEFLRLRLRCQHKKRIFSIQKVATIESLTLGDQEKTIADLSNEAIDEMRLALELEDSGK